MRRWDGYAWTDATLDNYWMPDAPHTVGPTTRIALLTRAQTRWRLKIWAVLMVIGCLAALVFELAK